MGTQVLFLTHVPCLPSVHVRVCVCLSGSSRSCGGVRPTGRRSSGEQHTSTCCDSRQQARRLLGGPCSRQNVCMCAAAAALCCAVPCCGGPCASDNATAFAKRVAREEAGMQQAAAMFSGGGAYPSAYKSGVRSEALRSYNFRRKGARPARNELLQFHVTITTIATITTSHVYQLCTILQHWAFALFCSCLSVAVSSCLQCACKAGGTGTHGSLFLLAVQNIFFVQYKYRLADQAIKSCIHALNHCVWCFG